MRTKQKKGIWMALRRNYPLYIMALPAMILLFVFAYMPLAGLIVAFKEYQFTGGIFGSPWINPWFKNFEILFNNPNAYNAIKNTLILNAMFIVIGTSFALALALAFNELRSQKLKTPEMCSMATRLPCLSRLQEHSPPCW